MNIEHFAINVPDPVAAANWYVQHLSMRVVRSLEEAPFTRFLADESGRVVVEMYRQTKVAVPNYEAMDPLVFHIAFVTDDVAGTRDRLMAAGASSTLPITTTSNGDEMTFLRDPWSVPLQLVKRVRPLRG